jgi:hypothetical protein
VLKFRGKPLTWRHGAIIAGVAAGIWVFVEIMIAGGGVAPLPPSRMPIKLFGGHVMNNRIATKSWTFDYDRAQLSPDGMTGTVDGVRNGVIFRKGKPYLRLSAQHVRLDVESLDFTAIGKVHVELIGDPLHRSFDTDLVRWTNDAQLLKMEHPAYVHFGNKTLLIDGITVDFDANTVHFGKINGNVEVGKG